MNRFSAILAPVAFITLLLAIWEAACRLTGVPQYLLPPPSAIAGALAANAPMLAVSAWRTLAMALEALAAAAVFAGGLALAVTLSRTLDQAVRPLAVALQVTPVVAIAPLFVIWAGVDHPGRAIIALARSSPSFRSFRGPCAD